MRLPLAPGDDVLTLVRDAQAESLVVVSPGLKSPEVSMMRASIELLAVERAPAVRVNAVVAAATAQAGDVEAAIVFLEGARSTTGQVIEVS